MNLATFDSREEASYFITASPITSIWLGIRDNQRNRKFQRVTDGVDVTGILPWIPRQPSGREYCVEKYTGRGYSDAPCRYKKSFCCEYINV